MKDDHTSVVGQRVGYPISLNGLRTETQNESEEDEFGL